ncbi:hypothetical protein Bca101_026835 [Brassica carinata]
MLDSSSLTSTLQDLEFDGSNGGEDMALVVPAREEVDGDQQSLAKQRWLRKRLKRRRSTSWCSGDIDGARDTVEMKKKANAKRDSVIARFINVVGIAITASGVQLLRPRVQR